MNIQACDFQAMEGMKFSKMTYSLFEFLADDV